MMRDAIFPLKDAGRFCIKKHAPSQTAPEIRVARLGTGLSFHAILRFTDILLWMVVAPPSLAPDGVRLLRETGLNPF